MRKVLCSILVVAFIAVLSYPASGQVRLGGGGPMGDIFQGQPPPPGAVTVLGRSFFGSLEGGFDSSLALLIGADDRNVRQEIGLTDTEANSIRLLRAQMLMGAAQYANRFRTMTEETQASVQADLSRDMGRITETLNTAIPQERRDNVQRLIFQTLGGLDSPIITPSTLEVLELSESQRGQVRAVFAEMQEERVAQMETMLGMAERVIAAGGPQNLSQEEREELDRQRRELEAQSFATARRLAERLRQHLTPAQLERERQLIASRPGFLPPLPPQLRQGNQQDTGGGTLGPGAGAWRPGDELPVQIQERPRGRFPRAE